MGLPFVFNRDRYAAPGDTSRVAAPGGTGNPAAVTLTVLQLTTVLLCFWFIGHNIAAAFGMDFRAREQQVLQKWGWDVFGASSEEEARDAGKWLCAPGRSLMCRPERCGRPCPLCLLSVPSKTISRPLHQHQHALLFRTRESWGPSGFLRLR